MTAGLEIFTPAGGVLLSADLMTPGYRSRQRASMYAAPSYMTGQRLYRAQMTFSGGAGSKPRFAIRPLREDLFVGFIAFPQVGGSTTLHYIVLGDTSPFNGAQLQLFDIIHYDIPQEGPPYSGLRLYSSTGAVTFSSLNPPILVKGSVDMTAGSADFNAPSGVTYGYIPNSRNFTLISKSSQGGPGIGILGHVVRKAAGNNGVDVRYLAGETTYMSMGSIDGDFQTMGQDRNRIQGGLIVDISQALLQ